MMRLMKAVLAGCALLAITVGPAWALVHWIGNPWPAEGVSLHGGLPDDAIKGILAVAVWILWLQMVSCIIAEAVAVITDDRIRITVPFAFGAQQHLARQLVTAVAVATIATPMSLGSVVGMAAPAAAPAAHAVAASATAPSTPTAPATPVIPAASATIGAASPPVARAATSPALRLTSTTPAGPAPSSAATPNTPTASTAPAHPAHAAPRRLHRVRLVTVKKWDTLWSIAERYLGSGERWEEIKDLNEGRTMNDGTKFVAANQIKEGWELRVPLDPHVTTTSSEDPPERVVVIDGDTLSEIALEDLGNASEWHEIYDDNQAVIGSDPDLIYPGEILRLPSAPHTAQDHPSPPADHTGNQTEHHQHVGPSVDKPHGNDGKAGHTPRQSNKPNDPSDPTASPSAPATSAPSAQPSAQPSAPISSSSSSSGPAPNGGSHAAPLAQTPERPDAPEASADHGFSALRILLASAACLSVGLLGLVLANRRRQLRARRPGRTIAALPPHLAQVERDVVETGTAALSQVAFRDLALRILALHHRQTGDRLPQLGAAVHASDELTLLFLAPATAAPPPGWVSTGDARAWTVSHAVLEAYAWENDTAHSTGSVGSTDMAGMADAASLQGSAGSLGPHAGQHANAEPTLQQAENLGVPVPYPALVSVGDDAAGRTWMIDLEAIGAVGIAGEATQAENMARFIVAELAVNAWSEGIQVLLADGFAAETIALNPTRLRACSAVEALRRAQRTLSDTAEAESNLHASLLDLRRDGELTDSTGPVVVVLPAADSSRANRGASDPVHGTEHADMVAEVEDLDRSRAVIIQVAPPAAGQPGDGYDGPGDGSGDGLGGEAVTPVGLLPAIELDRDGTAYLPEWGVRLKPLLLPAEQVAGMVELATSTRNLDDIPMPPLRQDRETHDDHGAPAGSVPSDGDDDTEDDTQDGEVRALDPRILADGSLPPDLTQPRPDDQPDDQPDGADDTDDAGGTRGAAGTGLAKGSLLPAPDHVYLTKAATNSEELARLAPVLPANIRAAVEALDPTLDQDIAAWFDPNNARPKVQLLGPVEVTAIAGDRESVTNIGGATEFIVYLACQDRGVTKDRAADALGWSGATVQNRARDARRLLGTREDGTEWLPEAGKSQSARKRGIASYELETGQGGVLVSPDLFRRLRQRAQARGADGIEDLQTALRLVAGEPFDQLRRGGYGWLLEGQRLDHIMVGAIEDVAHIVATREIAAGHYDTARWACEVALKANPYSDVVVLDLAAVAEEETSRAAADRVVREQILGRSDDDLPQRTDEVIGQRRWLTG